MNWDIPPPPNTLNHIPFYLLLLNSLRTYTITKVKKKITTPLSLNNISNKKKSKSNKYAVSEQDTKKEERKQIIHSPAAERSSTSGDEEKAHKINATKTTATNNNTKPQPPSQSTLTNSYYNARQSRPYTILNCLLKFLLRRLVAGFVVCA